MLQGGGGEAGGGSHDGEANPLDSYLRDAQEAGGALEGTNLLAARDVATRLRQGQDVAELGVGASDAEENEVGRDALGGASGNDAIMLQKVGKQDAYDDETGSQGSSSVSALSARVCMGLLALTWTRRSW